MKNITIVGIVLLLIAFLLYYAMPEFSISKLLEPISLMGILAGVGLGLLLGGIVGYISKGSAIKADLDRKKFKIYMEEKERLEQEIKKDTI